MAIDYIGPILNKLAHPQKPGQTLPTFSYQEVSGALIQFAALEAALKAARAKELSFKFEDVDDGIKLTGYRGERRIFEAWCTRWETFMEGFDVG